MRFFVVTIYLLFQGALHGQAVKHPKLEGEIPRELLQIDNGTAKVGIDRAKGASITWLSWKGHPKNVVNLADPGRLIQQSYYAGHRLDRRAEGQHEAWSPWSWNPIQGGGVGSWAKVSQFKKEGERMLFGETIPKLWDMKNEDAKAVMRQWTGFEEGLENVVAVRCEFVAKRNPGDRWGPVKPSPQEIPACYFTRKFEVFETYLGDGKWRRESQSPGPPWGNSSDVPGKAMACFTKDGQGVAIYAPSAKSWNFGPHGGGLSDDPLAGPCCHIAPVDRILLGPRSTLRYRYWLVVGAKKEIVKSLQILSAKYSGEEIKVSNPD
jgi:hypothetical protein